MLRSIFNAPLFALLTFKPTNLPQLRPSPLNLCKHRRSLARQAGTMAEVLEILGPLDYIFPVSDADPYFRFLRKCIRSKNFFTGSLAHAHLIKSGVKDSILANVMLFVYSRAGLLGSCVKVFDEMPERDLFSWCTLISGYVACGFEEEAFGLLKLMMSGSVKPNQFVISSVLKGCAASGIPELGIVVHGLTVKTALGFDRFVEIGLLDMYAKCKALRSALKMFDEIPVKSSVTWNAMISGYAWNGLFIEAVELCREMCQVGLPMDLVTLRVVANAAACLEVFEFCRNLHVYAIKVGFDRDTFVTAELVRLLSRVGEVDYMGELFKKVRNPDVSLYSLLISGYHINGHRAEAVKLAQELLVLNLDPKQGALINVLNLCICKDEGAQIHAHILKSGHLSRISVGNALISMYIKFGAMMDAKLTFHGMTIHDVVSWTAIMAGLVQNLKFGESLETFRALGRTGIQLDQHSIATTINACAGLQAIDNGQQIHALGLKLGFEFSHFICASLLHMYSNCGHIKSAAKLFSFASSYVDLILINVMIAAYRRNSLPDKALELFSWEYKVGLIPDQFSISAVLGACADVKSLENGEQIHSRVVKSGFDVSDVIVGNAVLNMYIKSGSMASAFKFFSNMISKNMNSHEIVMMGYIQNMQDAEAPGLSYLMQQSSSRANQVTSVGSLGQCADLGAIELVKQIHASIIKMGLHSDSYIGNVLHVMYAEFGNRNRIFESSRDMSTGDNMKDRNKERTVEDFSLFKLEEETEFCYNYSDASNFFPVAPYHIYDIPLLVHNGLNWTCWQETRWLMYSKTVRQDTCLVRN